MVVYTKFRMMREMNWILRMTVQLDSNILVQCEIICFQIIQHLFLTLQKNECLQFDWYNKLTPWNRVLFEKLVVTQLVKYPCLLWTLRFITVFTTAHHWSQSWQMTPVHTFPPYFHKKSSEWPLPCRFSNQNSVCISSLSHVYDMPCNWYNFNSNFLHVCDWHQWSQI
jgi:hypothetical protein